MLGVEKNECTAQGFLMPYDALEWDIFHIKNNQLIILFIIYTLLTLLFLIFRLTVKMKKKKVVLKLWQEVKVKVNIVTSDINREIPGFHC